MISSKSSGQLEAAIFPCNLEWWLAELVDYQTKVPECLLNLLYDVVSNSDIHINYIVLSS